MMEDRQIISLYFERDERALKETENSYGHACRAVSLNILHNGADAEECVNDTWIRTWNSIPPQKPKSLKAYVLKIVRNISFDRWEKEHAAKRGGGQFTAVLDELSECVPSSANVEQEVSQKLLSEAISAFLKGRNRRDSSLFVRRYFFAEPVSVIAEQAGIAPNNVTSILYRLRCDLKTYLEKEGFL